MPARNITKRNSQNQAVFHRLSPMGVPVIRLKNGKNTLISTKASNRANPYMRHVSIRNWKIIDTWQYSGIKTRETTLGDPEMLGKKIERASSTYGFAIRIKRQAWSFLIKMLVPLVLVMLVCYIQFFFPPNQLTGRISIGVTTLLTAIAYHLTQARQLAGIGYIIKSDMIFWLAYIMIFLSILEATISFSFYTKGMTKISARLDTFSKVSFFILYIIFLAIVIII